jgi:hypothetical protein
MRGRIVRRLRDAFHASLLRERNALEAASAAHAGSA